MAKPAGITFIAVVDDLPSQSIIGRLDRGIPQTKLPEYFQEHYPAGAVIISGLSPQVTILGCPLAVYYMDVNQAPTTPRIFDVEAAFPVQVSGEEPELPAPWKLHQLPSGKVLKAVFMGAYDGLPEAWTYVISYLKEIGVSVRGEASWEHYVNDPTTVADSSEIQTDIYIPVN